jgi:hypothetical protein
MLNLLDSVRSQCADLDPALVEMHFRRLPTTYFERYSAAEMARHLRLLAALGPDQLVDVAVYPLASQTFEMVVVGLDYSGTLACITATLAAYGFDLDDVQVSPYLEQGSGVHDEPRYFVIVLRVSGSIPGRSLINFVAELRGRLRLAFGHLAQGNLLEAQTVAADRRELSSASTPVDAAPSAPAKPRPAGYEGLILGGDFRLERKLATGGMSEIYLATQLSLNRTVAVKIFQHEGPEDDELLMRIKKEALVLAQFSCAQIVPIFAAGTAPEQARGALGWMAMEYMAGGDLGHWLDQHGAAPVELGLRWLREALEGLHYAHRHAIVHRDLKPHNLLLTVEGHVKVSDFGLLKGARQLRMEQTPQAAIVGTPQFMSPEQALGEPLDERSDIFSLGTTFFYLLSGQLPFQASTPTAMLVQIAQRDAPRLDELMPQAPLPLAVIIGRMMARLREARYQDIGVILEDLTSYERRGLLLSSQSGTFVGAGAAPVQRVDIETQAYEPPPERADDL